MIESELRTCLGELLGEPVPEPDDEPLRFYRQWLAERNLGLVPIADPASFEWPGMWLARVRGDHAVLMYGSPSGPMVDPAGAFTENAAIEAGWLLAPLDHRLPSERPYGESAGDGTVAALLLAGAKEAPLAAVEEAVAVAGRGLAGDRYHAGAGTFSGRGRGYELTLVQAEVLDELGLPWPDARRNVVTRGVELNALVGRRFRIGAVECVGRRLAEPCAHLERLTRPGLMRPLVHRAGLRSDILVGGAICVGDVVSALD